MVTYHFGLVESLWVRPYITECDFPAILNPPMYSQKSVCQLSTYSARSRVMISALLESNFESKCAIAAARKSIFEYPPRKGLFFLGRLLQKKVSDRHAHMQLLLVWLQNLPSTQAASCPLVSNRLSCALESQIAIL